MKRKESSNSAEVESKLAYSNGSKLEEKKKIQ